MHRKQAIVGSLLFWAFAVLLHAAPAPLRLPAGKDAFFVEHDFVYSRCLWLRGDGSYHQIDRVNEARTESDRGTWEQNASGVVFLHFTRGGLRFHALLSGPLSIGLQDPSLVAALPAAVRVIRLWLDQSNDTVFSASSLAEVPLAPLAIAVDSATDTFRRTDLESLNRRIENYLDAEQRHIFELEPIQATGMPRLLAQRGGVFQHPDLARVLSEYHVPPHQAPPFYFAQVDAGTFAKEVGSWQEGR